MSDADSTGLVAICPAIQKIRRTYADFASSNLEKMFLLL